MGAYKAINIKGNSTGLVQSREEFLLPDDAYPVLFNAYLWRERILRKRGCELLGRLQRNLSAVSIGNISSAGAGVQTYSIFSLLGLSATEPNASIAPGTAGNPIVISIGAPIVKTLTDSTGQGVFTISSAGNITSATINYATGVVTLTFAGPTGVSAATLTASYYPALPVMGISIRELRNSTNDQTIFFDQKYAYIFNSVANAFQEFLPGTTWNASGAGVSAVDFFWSTNYWVSQTPQFTTSNDKLMWVTNDTGASGATADPIRVTDGTTWFDFSPANNQGQIDATTFMTGALILLPFRGRLLALNTWEGPNYAGSLPYTNRIRWSTIGNPFIAYSNSPPATGSWRDDIRGQGGFLDLPTSEDIVSAGFVRDNLVIYCERSTWQLRYTGRTISPFQVERVNSELGAESTFSAVQFDTALVGVGDKGIVECDSYKSERIDVKIPDLIFGFESENSAVKRVHGIRDFVTRIASWTYVDAGNPDVFPNRRLIYNYENDSWSVFRDSYTALGNYQPQTSRSWINTVQPWTDLEWTWIDQAYGVPDIVGGNQQGFIEFIDVSNVTTNDVSLYIQNIVGSTSATVITSPNHNLVSGDIITFSGIPASSSFASLNGNVFQVFWIDVNNFSLFSFNANSQTFSTPRIEGAGTYFGGGGISILDNFVVQSKKFNFMDDGQNIQLGYLDILMDSTGTPNPGAITINVYLNYQASYPSNILPQNALNTSVVPLVPDPAFNSTIPTTFSASQSIGGTKIWQRVYCATSATFLTLVYTFSPAQMNGVEQRQNVQIDAQVLWVRRSGRMTVG